MSRVGTPDACPRTTGTGADRYTHGMDDVGVGHVTMSSDTQN